MATYILLCLIVTALVALVVYLWKASLMPKKIALVFGILFVATVVFDNLIIAAGLVDYDNAKTLGVRIGLAPIEDFFYTLVVAVFVPYMWERGKNARKD